MGKGSQNISAVIITFNEEDNLERCLRSLEGVFDEIVIIDSGSTDQTIEIARNFGIEPIYRKFTGFGEQKRFAVASARNDYVFSIDADEELSLELREAILKIDNINDHDAYLINRLSSLSGQWIKHSGWHPDWLIRLWNRKKGNLNRNLVHESVEFDSEISIKKLTGLLLHYTCPDMACHIESTARYAALKVKNKGKERVPGAIYTVFRVLFKWIKIYFIKLGFLDGKMGRRIASVAALGNLMEYAEGRKMINRDFANQNTCFVNTSIYWGEEEMWYLRVVEHFHDKNSNVFAITQSKGQLKTKLHELGITTFDCRTSMLSKIMNFRQFVSFFKENRIQTVILFKNNDLKFYGLAAWLAGVPDIVFQWTDNSSEQSLTNTFFNKSVVTRYITISSESIEKQLTKMHSYISSKKSI